MLDKIFGKVEDIELVEKALTHPSYTKELNLDELLSYERLEFFGDSVLKLFTSKLLYNTYPDYPEGNLSKIRSILVSDNILQDGDTITIIKDLKVKGASGPLKQGTKVKNIRLVYDSDHNIDCNIPGFGAMSLKSEFVKKA